jgi:hypothetical protein
MANLHRKPNAMRSTMERAGPAIVPLGARRLETARSKRLCPANICNENLS